MSENIYFLYFHDIEKTKNMHGTSGLQMWQLFVFACLQNRNILENLCFPSGVLFNEAGIYILLTTLTLLFIYAF